MEYDVTVIGGGAAGLTAAGMSASLGAKTLLVEENRLGGDCTWTGCVPSKSLLAKAKKVHTAAEMTQTDPGELFDFAELMGDIQDIQQGIYDEADSPQQLEKFGVETQKAQAALTGTNELTLTKQSQEQEKISSRFIFIATGAKPFIPPIDGLKTVEYETSESIFSLSNIPSRLGIIGGGPIGVELGQAFARLGTEVTIFESSESILSQNADRLSRSLMQELHDDGVRFQTNSRVSSVSETDEDIEVHTSGEESVAVDKILVAVGRAPNFKNLNLERVQVETTDSGIPTNNYGQTNQSHIYAVGDVTQGPRFTHQAEQEAKSAVLRALYKLPVSKSNPVPRVVYTDPELAAVGKTEKQLSNENTGFDTYTFPYSKLDRALTEQKTTGQIRVYTPSGSGDILGAEVLGERAGEVVNELSVAIEQGITLRNLARTVHPYPTYNQIIRRSADQFMVQNQPITLLHFVKWLLGYQGSIFQPDDDQIV